MRVAGEAPALRRATFLTGAAVLLAAGEEAEVEAAAGELAELVGVGWAEDRAVLPLLSCVARARGLLGGGALPSAVAAVAALAEAAEVREERW